MKPADWILLALIALWCGQVLFRRKKKSSCDGCKGCQECCNCHKNVV